MNKIPETVAIIACVDKTGGISKGDFIPWSNPKDISFFKETTQRSIVIMGKNTYNELNVLRQYKNPLLNNRISIVVSSTLWPDEVNNAHVVKNIHEAYNLAIVLAQSETSNIFFIGGVEIFRQSVQYINKIYLNQIDLNYDCDKFFPGEILKEFNRISSYNMEELNLSEFVKKVE